LSLFVVRAGDAGREVRSTVARRSRRALHSRVRRATGSATGVSGGKSISDSGLVPPLRAWSTGPRYEKNSKVWVETYIVVEG